MEFNHFQLKNLRPVLSLLFSLLLLVSFVNQRPQAQSQTPGDLGATEKTDKAQLHQALLDLTSTWTVMCVAAHPDDEDGSTLTVLRRKYGIHTVTLFSTFGEGGQNAVGPELYEELGVIRARETIAAAEVQGSEPHFLGMRDFGFSKSAEETFRAWGEKETLRRMVLQIRQLRPDVIITNHDTTNGHGHHQATGRIVTKAFNAAADPKQFPEQLNQASTWQVQRLFVRAPRNQSETKPGETKPQATLQVVTMDPNESDPIRGTTFAHQALSGLQKHATQGPWPKAISPNGARIIRYNLVRQAPSAPALPADAKTPLDGLQLPESMSQRFVAPTIDSKPLTDFIDNRGEVLVSLINARKRGAFTAPGGVLAQDPQRFQLMSSRLDAALTVALGLSLQLKANDSVLVPGVATQIDVSLANGTEMDIVVKGVVVRGLGQERRLDAADKLLPTTDTTSQTKIRPPKTADISLPSSAHLYDSRLFGEVLTVAADLEVEGARFSMLTATHIDVAPAVEIKNNNPTPCVETPATLFSCASASLTLTNHLRTPFKGAMELSTPLVGDTEVLTMEIALEPLEARSIITRKISAIPERELLSLRTRNSTMRVLLLDSSSKHPITEKIIPAVYVPGVAVAGIRLGYVASTDQSLKQSLDALGVESKALSVDDIATGDLASLNTIIIDNRGYEVHPELIGVNDRLLKYVEDGGTLLVFYHKTNEWNPDERRTRPQLAPYPIILDDDRVTEEDAPVTFLQPRHPLLNFPNRITQADFANWIQERGLYFPKDWDSHYTALLSTHDKHEPPLRGGLLVARYGKGNYVYTSMVWYRQLRAGLAGGYRFFANLISYGQRKEDGRKQQVSISPE